jgi:autotransporter-associated beta strand protein
VGNSQIGGGFNFAGNMTLLNQGLISSQSSGRTVTINPATSFTNAGTIEAINGAVLSITNGYTQSAGVTRVNNGTINSTTISLTAGTLEGSGTINATVNSSGIINLNADGTIAGPLNATGGSWIGQGIVTGLTTVSVGTFTIGNGAHLHANGNLNVTGVGTIAAASATAKITGTVSYLSSSNSAFVGILAGAGKTVTMNNAVATFTLAGANTCTGATTVTAGILKAGIVSVSGVSGAFGRNSPVTMANVASALLDITGFDTQIGSLSGGGTSGGNVTLGAATLTFAGTNTSPAVYSGNVSGSGGTNKSGPGTQTFNGTRRERFRSDCPPNRHG